MDKSTENQSKSILVIDDSSAQRNFITVMLQEQGYTVYVASNGEQGLIEVEKRLYDLILLDVVMPDISGFEVIKVIRNGEINKNTPVIFLTGVSDDENIIHGYKLGANDFVSKPFKKEILQARIETQLKLSETQCHLQNEIIEKEKLIKRILFQKDKLSTLNNTKDKILSILVHDIKNQITSIMGMSDMLLVYSEKYSEEKKQKYLQLINSNTVSVSELIENLLRWAGKNWSNEVFNPEIVDVKIVVDECIGHFGSMASVKHISLQSVVAAGDAVYADKEMLKVILRNIIANSIKFTPKNGRVTISSEAHLSGVMQNIIIEDTGIGIAKDALNTLFNLHQETKVVGTFGEKGTGLGLQICNEYVAKNSGSIVVESEINKGTRFIVSLPKEKPAV